VAYFSKKLLPAESNYEIHDKKLLAIIRAMKKWKKELIKIKNPFIVLFNHKNLQYFMTTRKLSERQIRWFLTFSQFRFQLKFRAGKKAQRPNALLKREQNMPGGKKDERFKNRINQLLKNKWLPSKYRLKKKSEFVQIQITRTESEKSTNTTETFVNNKRIPKDCDILENQKAQLIWDKRSQVDESFRELYRSFWKGDKTFPPQCAH
jgi:hypothetical protein